MFWEDYITFLLLYNQNQMENRASKILFLVVTLCMLETQSNQCLRYNGTLCLECLNNYHPNGANCTQDLVQIKPKTANQIVQPAYTQDIFQNTYYLTPIQKVSNNYNSSASSQKQPINSSINEADQVQNEDPSSNSMNLIRINAFNPTQTAAASIQNSITLDDIRKYSDRSTYIQGIYINYSRLILENELNKISLELFQYTKETVFDDKFDPILHEVLINIIDAYGKKLKKFNFLAAYFRYVTFAKIYKIFFVDLTSIQSIEIDEVDAIVDLFHMQVFTSSFSVYCTVKINETTIQSIKNSTKNN